jgi:hypothetical protein
MKRFGVTSALLLAAWIGAPPCFAQQAEIANANQQDVVLIPGALKGIGTMGPRGERRLCAPLSIGLYEWRVKWIERFVRQTDDQRASLNELVAASAKAKATITAACPNEPMETTVVQLAVVEKRVAALTEALKIVRPAYEKFYASLDNRQKALLDALGPGRRGWRW